MPNELDNFISVFENAKITKPKESITISEMLERIQSGYYSDFVNAVRSGTAEKLESEAFTLSGTFKERNSKGLEKYSGLIQIDIDKVNDIAELRAKLINDKYSVFVLTSISGNGLKVAWRINQEQHTPDNFKQIESYFKDTYNVQIDKAVKDISRLFFISYDSDLFINDKAEAFKFKVIKTIEKKAAVKNVVSSQSEYWHNKAIDTAINIINQSIKGNKHYSRLRAGVLLGGYISGGLLDEQTAINELRGVIQSNTTLNINVAMKAFLEALNYGKNKPITKNDYNNNTNSIIEMDGVKFNRFTGEILPEIEYCFWKLEYIGKQSKISIDYVKLYEFFRNKGVRYINLDKDGLNKLLIRIENNIVSEINIAELSSVVNKYLNSLSDIVESGITKVDLINAFSRGLKVYINEHQTFFHIDTIEIDFIKDTSNAGYFYFKNGFVEITKDKAEIKSYQELKGCIWKNQIISRNLDELLNENSLSKVNNLNFVKFTQNICTDRVTNELDTKRYTSLIHTIGYLLHNNNEQVNRKAVILCEVNLTDKKQGRTGKGLLIESIRQLRNILLIDGKNFDFGDRFAFQGVELDTALIIFNDVKDNFPFERLFSAITEGVSFEKKGKSRINIAPERSPKIAISTNFAITGNSESDKARKFEMELLPYYNSYFTPLDEFQSRFFNDWSSQDWNLFYNFMIYCLQTYLKAEKIPSYNSVTIEAKKLITETSSDFVEFADGLERNQNLSIVDTYDNFINFSGNNPKTFSKIKLGIWLKTYCEYMNLNFISKNTAKNQKCYYLESKQ